MPKIKSNRVAVYVFRLLPAGTQYLQLRRAVDSGDYAGTWQTVYGRIKSGETAVTAARRELLEETGLVPKELFQVEYLESFYHRARDRVTVLPVFAAQVATNAEVLIDEEHDDYRWVDLADAPTHFVWRVQRQAIAIIEQDILGTSPAKDLLTITRNGKKEPRASH